MTFTDKNGYTPLLKAVSLGKLYYYVIDCTRLVCVCLTVLGVG